MAIWALPLGTPWVPPQGKSGKGIMWLAGVWFIRMLAQEGGLSSGLHNPNTHQDEVAFLHENVDSTAIDLLPL